LSMDMMVSLSRREIGRCARLTRAADRRGRRGGEEPFQTGHPEGALKTDWALYRKGRGRKRSGRKVVGGRKRLILNACHQEQVLMIAISALWNVPFLLAAAMG